MKKKNWTLIEPASKGGSMLPAGGYVVVILKVEDDPEKEYLEFTYDIAEGEHARHYSDDYGVKNPYTHQFRRWYSDKAENFFRQFLDCLEASNEGFSVEEWSKESDEQQLRGLKCGIVFQMEQYTNGKGEDKKRLNDFQYLPAQDIRDGNFTVPPEADNREKVVNASSAAYDGIPF